MEELERKKYLGSIELGTVQVELLALDMQHQVTASHVFHNKVDARLCLEARVQQ